MKIFRITYHYSGNIGNKFFMDVSANNPKDALAKAWEIVGHNIIRDSVKTLGKRLTPQLNKEFKVKE